MACSVLTALAAVTLWQRGVLRGSSHLWASQRVLPQAVVGMQQMQCKKNKCTSPYPPARAIAVPSCLESCSLPAAPAPAPISPGTDSWLAQV